MTRSLKDGLRPGDVTTLRVSGELGHGEVKLRGLYPGVRVERVEGDTVYFSGLEPTVSRVLNGMYADGQLTYEPPWGRRSFDV